MRIESVHAHGFGPLVGESLSLAPGLTIVVGDNEAGKSSWHAATFAALCGRRRARGRPSAEEQQFIDAHQPWSGGPWAVSCLLSLDDGRRIEVRQDLTGKVDCRASDTELARDVSAEIMVDGSPDAAAWLGLTRTSFRATACVGQAEVLSVVAAADGLQHALQRATSTAGAAGTAAEAIALLESTRRSAVGRDTVAAVRPLRKAIEAVAAAQEQVSLSNRARADLEERAAQEASLALEVERTKACAEVAAAEAAQVTSALREVERRDFRRELSADLARETPPEPAAEKQRRSSLVGALALAAALVGLVVVTFVAGWVPAALAGVGGAAAVAAWRWDATRRGASGVESLHEVSAGPRSESGQLLELRLQLAEQQALADGARRRHQEVVVRAGQAQAVRAERARGLPSGAEAEEALAAAERELERVRALDETLRQSIEFLSRAEERVHRAVAPELTGLLRGWLPRLTAGRYVDARLDPATLAVEVCGRDGLFRRADLLSHGTAEQIYLLLRVALAERLTAGHDTCPLLLDDVTVHADPTRTEQVLELLLELSADRQIVLFAHQERVLDWARERLAPGRDALVVLDRVGVP